MRESLRLRIDLYNDNFKYLRKSKCKYLTSDFVIYYCALLYTSKNLTIDLDKLRLCEEIIKNNARYFSEFRTVKLIFAAMLSLYDNPEQKFQDVLSVFEHLRTEFRVSFNLCFSAFLVSDLVPQSDRADVIKRAKRINTLIKKPRLLPRDKNNGLLLLLAIRQQSVEDTALEIERHQSKMHIRKIASGVDKLSVCCVLLLVELDENTKLSTLRYYNENLNGKGNWFISRLNMAIMSTFVSVKNKDELIQDVSDVIEYFRKNVELKTMFMTKSRLLTLASLLVSVEYPSDTMAPFLRSEIDNRVSYISMLIDQYQYYGIESSDSN